MMIEPLYDFSLTAEQEARARTLHESSIILDMLFQGPVGTYSLPEGAEEELLALAQEACPGDEIAQCNWATAEILRRMIGGSYSQLYKDCWYDSGLTGGCRQLSVTDRDEALRSAVELQAEFDTYPWLVKCTSVEQIRRCKKEGLKAGIVTSQEAEGYAFVIQDVRGRSDSDGTLEAFQHEREDADDLFNWIAAQPWSDGNIGMWGASYLGYTTTSACTSGNPHLKTAVSEVNVGSPFYDTVRKGGTVCSWPLLCWTLAQSVSNRVDMDVFKGVSIDPLEAVRIRPITAIPEKIVGCRSTSWDMWSKHYHYDDFWRHSDNTAHADNIRIPMLILSGWYDGDALGVQETWRFLSKSPVPGHRIVLGPWPHGLNAWRDSMDLAFGNNAVDYDFDTRIIRWFDHYLKGIENGEDKKPKATYYVNGENQWHTSEDWMPKEARLVNLYLDSDGHANSMNGDGRVTLTPAETGSDAYVYDPEFPCGGEGDGFDDGLVSPYKCNSRQIRSDVLVYDTPVLEQDIAIAGPLYAELYAASSAVDTDYIVRVSDVDEQGTARNVSFNIIRAEFRKGWDKPELLTPGKIEKYEMEMYFYGMVFKKGHKIRIDISSSELMEAFPNTNTGIDPYTDPKPIKATQTIYHGREYPSHVKLPVLYGL